MPPIPAMLDSIRRTLIHALLPLGVALALTATSSAQITSIGPFAGAESDGFETQGSGPASVCLPGRVFNNTADLCDSTGAAGMAVVPAASSGCQFFPRSGSFLAYCSHPCEIVFDQPAFKFGGYFGQFSGQGTAGGGVAEFYSSTNVLLWTQPILAPANCSWNWNGWQVTGVQGFSRVKFISFVTNPPFIGGLMLLDDMEVDYTPTCQSVSTYCTAKVNSLGCTPVIASSGVPSLSGPDNFLITASNVLNGKPGIMLWSLTPSAVPFFGGTMCLAAPITRTPGQNSGGSAWPAQDCTGTYSYHFSQGYMVAQLLPPSTRLYAQYWSRDPGSGPPSSPYNIGLTNALTFMICP
jgi:hypothetical protein